MPGKKHLRGVGSKEQRQFEHSRENIEQYSLTGYGAKEVAARMVMKRHKKKGRRKGQ